MGGPDNSFIWEKNGTIIGNDSTVNLMAVGASQGGDYTCTVSNAAGSDSASTTLYVAPYIVTSLEEQILAVNGSNVNVTCNAAGFPAPIVTWVNMLDDEVSNTSQLLFTSVIFGDEGVYSCVASIEICGTNFSTRNDTILVGKLDFSLVNMLLISFHLCSLSRRWCVGKPSINQWQ
jgi:dystroglycan 1